MAMFVLTGISPAPAQCAEFVTAAPKEMGFSPERLKRLDTLIRQAVDDRQYGGAVVLLARHGKVVHLQSYGEPNLTAGAGGDKNSIFRLYSMSKPLAGAAMILLYEEGKWSPKDPISKFIPEFASLKVFKDVDGFGQIRLEEPEHAPTMRELMTHTAGFIYGGGSSPVDRFYRDEQGRGIVNGSPTLHAMIERLAKAPLLYQPSTRWIYSVSVDIQGYIIEKLSGMTMPEFLKRRLFEPLGMQDTGFYVPKEKWNRLATLYRVRENDKGGAITAEAVSDDDMTKANLGRGRDFRQEPSLPSGGGGMVSTAADYFRFAQMLLNGGELNGVRVLAPSSVKLMMSDHLPENMTSAYESDPVLNNTPRLGMGYGYDGAVVIDPGKADVPMGKGSYLWEGGLGTWFWADPVNDIVFVGMVQRTQFPGDKAPPTFTDLQELSRAVVYQALLKPEP
jgi:CubicO group peptidase (beta-lactamase class C family)